MEIIFSLLSGIIASFSPCAATLLPLALYRFFPKGELKPRTLLMFIIGFLVSFLILGISLKGIFSSSLQNGFRLGLGILFAFLGILSLLDRMNPMDFPLFKSSMATGASFAVIASLNPCSLPYIGLIVSSSDSAGVIAEMLAFGIGMIVPALVFAIAGKSILSIGKRHGKVLHALNKAMSIILIGAGLYMALTVKTFGRYDSFAVAGILSLAFIVLLKAFFILHHPRDLLVPWNIVLVASLLLIISATLIHCNSHARSSEVTLDSESQYACHDTTAAECDVCKRCIALFGLAAGLGFLGISAAAYAKKTI